MKVEPIEEYCVGKKVIVVVESLRPVKGEVRWFADRRAGIVFDKPLRFDELTEWVGKRLELASLKASYPGSLGILARDALLAMRDWAFLSPCSQAKETVSWPNKSQFWPVGVSGAPKRCSSTSPA